MLSVSDIDAYVKLTRPQNLSGSVVTYCIGYFLFIGVLKLDFFIGLIVLLALHSMATVQNDIEDFEIDRANKRESAVQDQSVSIASARLFVKALTLGAIILALLSAHRNIHLIFVALLLLLTWAYNLGPIRASMRPIGSIFIMSVCYGGLPFAYGYLAAGGNPTNSYFLILTFLWFLARFSTTIMKDYKDSAGDKRLGKNTFYLQYGRQVTAWTSIVTSILAYVGVIVVLLRLQSRTTLFFLILMLSILLALRNIRLRLMLTKSKEEKRLNTIFHRSVFGHNQFEVAVLLCLILS